MRKKKEPETKNCITCNGVMTQPRWANGKLDSTFKNRKFCSVACSKNFMLMSPAKNSATGRKRAQRMYQKEPCAMCGNLKAQRHHKNGDATDNSIENIIFLCQKCHVAEHVNQGNWGSGQIKIKFCVICGEQFMPKKTRDKLCKKPSCLKEMGRISAELRWAK